MNKSAIAGPIVAIFFLIAGACAIVAIKVAKRKKERAIALKSNTQAVLSPLSEKQYKSDIVRKNSIAQSAQDTITDNDQSSVNSTIKIEIEKEEEPICKPDPKTLGRSISISNKISTMDSPYKIKEYSHEDSWANAAFVQITSRFVDCARWSQHLSVYAARDQMLGITPKAQYVFFEGEPKDLADKITVNMRQTIEQYREKATLALKDGSEDSDIDFDYLAYTSAKNINIVDCEFIDAAIRIIFQIDKLESLHFTNLSNVSKILLSASVYLTNYIKSSHSLNLIVLKEPTHDPLKLLSAVGHLVHKEGATDSFKQDVANNLLPVYSGLIFSEGIKNTKFIIELCDYISREFDNLSYKEITISNISSTLARSIGNFVCSHNAYRQLIDSFSEFLNLSNDWLQEELCNFSASSGFAKEASLDTIVKCIKNTSDTSAHQEIDTKDQIFKMIRKSASILNFVLVARKLFEKSCQFDESKESTQKHGSNLNKALKEAIETLQSNQACLSSSDESTKKKPPNGQGPETKLTHANGSASIALMAR